VRACGLVLVAVLVAQLCFTGGIDPLTTLAMLLVIVGYVVTEAPPPSVERRERTQHEEGGDPTGGVLPTPEPPEEKDR